jgi:hypothetical protein
MEGEWEPRRLRSKAVTVGALGVLVVGSGIAALALQDKRCVDNRQTVVADSNCDRGYAGYRWYYGGRVRGGKATGGSFERGGFGRFLGGVHGG